MTLAVTDVYVQTPLTCPSCNGRGISAYVQKKTDSFPEARVCKRCKGRGSFSLNELARLLDVNPSDVYRVRDGRPSRKAGLVLLKRIAFAFPEALDE